MLKYLRLVFRTFAYFLALLFLFEETRVSTILNHYILQISRFCAHWCSEKRITSAHLSVYFRDSMGNKTHAIPRHQKSKKLRGLILTFCLLS